MQANASKYKTAYALAKGYQAMRGSTADPGGRTREAARAAFGLEPDAAKAKRVPAAPASTPAAKTPAGLTTEKSSDIVAREILVRLTPLGRGPWLFFLTTCVCLAFSALYELIEWWVAVFAGSDADAFLATQGDVWDTQWDMFLALLGAVSAQLLLGGLHDRQLRERGFVSASDAAADDYQNRQ
jgi:hypothetical protein